MGYKVQVQNQKESGPSLPPLPEHEMVPELPIGNLQSASVDRADSPASMFAPHVLPAPVFRPTAEEFQHPLRYIESIRAEAEQFGICKIIPPRNWRPLFSIDTRRFQFQSRVQQLNAMDGPTRARMNFLDGLARYHLQHLQDEKFRVPFLVGKLLDFYALKLLVNQRGGFHAVTENREWINIVTELKLDSKHPHNAANALKANYEKWVLPYEQFLASNGGSQSSVLDAVLSTPSSNKREPKNVSSTPTPKKTGLRSSKRTRDDDDEQISPQTPSRPRRCTRSDAVDTPTTRQSRRQLTQSRNTAEEMDRDQHKSLKGPRPKRAHKPANVPPGQYCEFCYHECDEELMLLCDDCELGYHTYCLQPALTHIPDTDWYCARCLEKGEDYAFGEGKVYTLDKFFAKDRKFKASLFPEAGETVANDQGESEALDCNVPQDPEELRLEKEFWRLAESTTENVTVEYGADLHSSIVGSGFPLSRNSDSKYAQSGWNLNNMPLLPESILRFIDHDISGMMVPWIYVGMCLSTFCWHTEDHFTSSINYVHAGDTKTWYGIPGSDAEAFEKAMRAEVPDLFATQPDLLFQITTMMSPLKLVEHGVRVVSCHQRWGEFVVTFPRSYHAGFNQGFNIAEAVNFALSDWAPHGLECVRQYQKLGKNPVFSHDNLLYTIYLNDKRVSTAKWLLESWHDLCEREQACRSLIRKRLPNAEFVELELQNSRLDADGQCACCNAFTPLSFVKCDCSESRIACSLHIGDLCKCPLRNRRAFVQLNDNRLHDILLDIRERLAVPEKWTRRAQNFLKTTKIPTLSQLEDFLNTPAEYEFENQLVVDIKNRIQQIRDWLSQVQKVMDKKRSVRKNHASLTFEMFTSLCTQFDHLNFTSPDAERWVEYSKQIHTLRNESRILLRKKSVHNSENIQALLSQYVQHDIENVPEQNELQTLLAALDWRSKYNQYESVVPSLEVANELLNDAGERNIPSDDPAIIRLKAIVADATRWRNEADEILNQLNKSKFNHEQIQALVDKAEAVAPFSPQVAPLDRLLHKHAELIKKCDSYLDPSSSVSFLDAFKLLKEVEKSPLFVANSSQYAQLMHSATQWHDKLTASFGQSHGPHPVSMDVFLRNFSSECHRICQECSFEALEKLKSDGSQEVYCICLTKDDRGIMIACDKCDQWYHASCVNFKNSTKSKGQKVGQEEKWFCPLCCSPTREQQKVRSTLTLADIVQLESDSQSVSHFVDTERKCLQKIIATLQQWIVEIQRTIRSYASRPAASAGDLKESEKRLVETMKHHLRQAEGLGFVADPLVQTLRTLVIPSFPSTPTLSASSISEGSTKSPLKTPNGKRHSTHGKQSLHSKKQKLTDRTNSQLNTPQTSIDDDRTPYCLCRKPAIDGVDMICCDKCDEWYHLPCVNLTPSQVSKIDQYQCPKCLPIRQSVSSNPPNIQHQAPVPKANSVPIKVRPKPNLGPMRMQYPPSHANIPPTLPISATHVSSVYYPYATAIASATPIGTTGAPVLPMVHPHLMPSNPVHLNHENMYPHAPTLLAPAYYPPHSEEEDSAILGLLAMSNSHHLI